MMRRIAFIAGLLLLAARIDGSAWVAQDVVSCVLPAPAEHPSASPDGALEIPAPDCGDSPASVRAAWMTAC
jgi:hypothetical protein